MSTDSDALDAAEQKIRKLEVEVCGEGLELNKTSNPIIECLLQGNTLMEAAISGHENFTILFKRIRELQTYLSLNPLGDNPDGLNTKLQIIMLLKEEYEKCNKEIEKINELKAVLEDEKLENVELLRNDLNRVLSRQLHKKMQLQKMNVDVMKILSCFNEMCVEISKSFFSLNEKISKLERSNANLARSFKE